MTTKCRCFICGRKDAGNNHIRNAYIRAGLAKDESGKFLGVKGRKHSRKVLRLREKREWREWSV